jgi:hypothetical protein
LVLIDKNGVKISDSNEKERSASKESFEKKQFSNLTSFKLAFEGKSGSIVEKFDSKESQITFLPLLFFHMIFYKIREFYYLFKFVTVMKEMNQTIA